MANWEAILKWSLRYHDGTRNEPEIDEERRQWLVEALQSIASAPSETQLLQAALTVLRAHSPAGGDEKEEEGGGGEEEEQLLKAFEEIQYLIEDFNHANGSTEEHNIFYNQMENYIVFQYFSSTTTIDLIPIEGVGTIASYLNHKKPSLIQSACELIATATQNNPKTQGAFLTTLPRLLTILNDRDLPSNVGVKAIYAVSCLTRSYEPGVMKLLSLDGLATLRLSLASEEQKIVVKTLFLLMSYFSPGQGEVKDEMVAQLPSLVSELVSLLRTAASDEVKGHSLSLLVTMVMHHPVAVVECRKEEVGLKSVLVKLRDSWTSEDHQEDLTSIKTLMETCFP